MKKTAKSLTAVLLTLVMLMSSFAVFSVSGGAAATPVSGTYFNSTDANRNGAMDVSDESGLDVLVGANASVSPNAKLQNAWTKSGEVDHYGLSFRVTRETEAAPAFNLRFRQTSSVLRTIVGTSANGMVTVFGTATNITLEIGVATEIDLDITMKWATSNSTNDGIISAALFVNGAYVGFYTATHKCTQPGSYIQINGSTNAQVTEENGKYLEAGKLGANAGAGHYATVLLEDIQFYTGNTTRILNSYFNSTDANLTGAKDVSVGGGLDIRIGTNASVALNAKLQNAWVSSGMGGLSFRVTRETEATPAFNIRFRESGSAYRSFVEFTQDGKVTVLNNEIATLEIGVPLDIYLDIDVIWAASGSITVTAYVNGESKGSYTATHKCTKPGSYIQINGSANTQVTEENGKYLEAGELGPNDAAGHYATMLLEDVTFFAGAPRDAFIYPGASMRLKEDAASSGLRFTYGVDKAWFDSLEGAKVGALIIPTDKLPNGFSEEALAGLIEETDYINIYANGFFESAEEADANTYVYYASLVNIRDKNYTRSFTGVGFVELADGTRIYTDVQSRSIYEVAKNATVSGDYKDTENESKIHAYLDKVISLDASFTVEEIANYSRNIVGAASGEGFTLTGEGVDKIKTIILNGVSYTGGWTVEGNVLTVLNCASN